MELIDQLRRHEGFRRHAYRCSENKLTIGYGSRIDGGGFGITEDAAELNLTAAVAQITGELYGYPWFSTLSQARQGVLINMAYQLGISGLKGFKRTLGHIAAGDYQSAANEMLDSRWAEQTPSRAFELSKQMREG